MQTGAALWVLPRADLLFVAYIDVGKGRGQDAQALLGFNLAHSIPNLASRLNRPELEQILIHKDPKLC